VITILPVVNAMLNGSSAVLLLLGHRLIHRGRVTAHRACMISGFGLSILFLISYLIYHSQVGSVRFSGPGWIRPIYFTILISHSLLAAAVVPLAVMTLYRALRGRFDQHRRIARWTFPIWLYVSTTGVIIYVMLYRL